MNSFKVTLKVSRERLWFSVSPRLRVCLRTPSLSEQMAQGKKKKDGCASVCVRACTYTCGVKCDISE